MTTGDYVYLGVLSWVVVVFLVVVIVLVMYRK